MIVHFRPTLDAIGEVQRELNKDPYIQRLVSTYTFLSVTEAGLYHITAELARDAVARGGAVGDEEYNKAIRARVEAERSAPMVAAPARAATSRGHAVRVLLSHVEEARSRAELVLAHAR